MKKRRYTIKIMEHHILNRNNTILNRFIAELRDVKIQKDSMRFRRNLERVGEVLAYEISKTLTYKSQPVETPLGVAYENLFTDSVVLATILRAGLPFHQGFLNYFDNAQNTFVSAFRKYTEENTLSIEIEYVSTCRLSGKVLVLADPMLATGSSLTKTYQTLVEKAGIPRWIHIAAAIASEQGVAAIEQYFAGHQNVTLWCGAVDKHLSSQSYIVPGLGDAGDLAYGEKL